MSQALISKITKKYHHTHKLVKSKTPIVEPSFETEEELWNKVKTYQDIFKTKNYFPNEDYINMMYALIYVYNSYVSPVNEIKPPVLNVSYHWDRANKVYVINLSTNEGVKLADNLNYLIGRGSGSWEYVNLKQVLNPLSLTGRHKQIFLSSIINQDTSLQYIPDEDQIKPMYEQDTPKKTPGQKLIDSELEISKIKEQREVHSIYKDIINIQNLIEQGAPSSEIQNKIILINSEIINNKMQLDVTITQELPISIFSLKYAKLGSILNNIEKWHLSNPESKKFPTRYKKILDSLSEEFEEPQVSTKIKGVELFPEESNGKTIIPVNVMRVILSKSLYIDIKLR